MIQTETKSGEPTHNTEGFITLYTCEDGYKLLFELYNEAYCSKKPYPSNYKLLVPQQSVIEENKNGVIVQYDKDIRVIEKLN